MLSTINALNSFLQGYELPVYPSDSVPDNASVPYLTAPLTEPEWDMPASWYIQGWFRTQDNVSLIAKADQIVADIGDGTRIPCDGGCVTIYPQSPLVQFLTDGDYRSFYINLQINAYHLPGV